MRMQKDHPKKSVNSLMYTHNLLIQSFSMASHKKLNARSSTTRTPPTWAPAMSATFYATNACMHNYGAQFGVTM